MYSTDLVNWIIRVLVSAVRKCYNLGSDELISLSDLARGNKI